MPVSKKFVEEYLKSEDYQEKLQYLKDNSVSFADPEDVEIWFKEKVLNIDLENLWENEFLDRVSFHVKRQVSPNGKTRINASELGALKKQEDGEYSYLGSAPEIIKERRFLTVTKHTAEEQARMLRGTEQEDLILKKMRHLGFERDHEAEHVFRSFMNKGGTSKCESLAGMPDAIMIDKNGDRFIVDAKSIGDPKIIDSWKSNQGKDNPYQYQVAAYMFLAKEAKIPVKGGYLAALDTTNWKINAIQLQFDEGVEDSIVAIVDKYSKMVHEGVTPTFAYKDPLDVIKDPSPELQAAAERLIIANKLDKVAKGKVAKAKEDLAQLVGDDAVNEGFVLSGIKVSTRSTDRVNANKVAARLSEMLIGAGVDESEITSVFEEFTSASSAKYFELTRSKKDPYFDIIKKKGDIIESKVEQIEEGLLVGMAETKADQELEDEFENVLSDDSMSPDPF